VGSLREDPAHGRVSGVGVRRAWGAGWRGGGAWWERASSFAQSTELRCCSWLRGPWDAHGAFPVSGPDPGRGGCLVYRSRALEQLWVSGGDWGAGERGQGQWGLWGSRAFSLPTLRDGRNAIVFVTVSWKPSCAGNFPVTFPSLPGKD